MSERQAIGVAGNGVRSVARALAALEMLVEEFPQPVRVKDVAARIEVDPATASRLLATLADNNYASRTLDRRFTLGPQALPLASHWLHQLRSVTAPLLTKVHAATGEAVGLVQLIGGKVAVVARSSPFGDSGLMSRIAPDDPMWLDMPLWATAAGRAVLGALPPPKRARLLPAEPYPDFTGNTTRTWSDVRAAIRDGNREGVYIEHGEMLSEACCYAISLRRDDIGAAMAMCVIAHGDLSTSRHGTIHRVLRDTARDLNVAVYNA